MVVGDTICTSACCRTSGSSNPLALNPYVLYKALPQVKRYSSAELVQAMDVLLRCNQRLVSSNLDEALVLQQALVQIVTPTTTAA